MCNLTGYRVLKRKEAVALATMGVCAGALIIWIGMEWVDAFSERISELVVKAPDKAGAELAQYLRIGSVLNGILIFPFAFFVSWYGLKGIRTQSMPPMGSWIVEGQQVRRGPKAIMISRLTVALGGLMALLAVASSMILWGLAGQMQRIGNGASL